MKRPLSRYDRIEILLRVGKVQIMSRGIFYAKCNVESKLVDSKVNRLNFVERLNRSLVMHSGHPFSVGLKTRH